MKKYLLLLLSILAAPWYLSAQTVTIEAGGKLTIHETARLETNNIVNNATANDLIIKCSSSGTSTGLLKIKNTGTPAATIERYIKPNRWTMITPPVVGEDGNVFIENGTEEVWLSWYNEPTATGDDVGNGWEYILDSNDPIINGKGYTCYVPTNRTLEFKGNINSADKTFSNLSKTQTGYHLIGNPFSGTINFNTSNWSYNGVDQELWIWNGSAYVNKPAGSGFKVSICQGFFVHASVNNASLTIRKTAVSEGDQGSFLKDDNTNLIGDYENALIITAYNNDYEDKVQISFQDNGTLGYDDGWDGTKLFGAIEGVPQVYLVEGEMKLTYNHLPLLVEGEEKTVAMNYTVGVDGEQTFIANFDYLTHADVMLEDLKTGTIINLRENNVYTFNGTKNDNPDRFLLHFTWSPNAIDEEIEVVSNVTIYAYNGEVYIRSTNDAINQSGDIFIYDLTGRELMHQRIGAGELIKLPVNISGNYIIAKVIKSGTIKTQKVYIK